jgi:hypothetical protein
MSKRECDVAAEKGDIYRVRRVFHFRNQVKSSTSHRRSGPGYC